MTDTSSLLLHIVDVLNGSGKNSSMSSTVISTVRLAIVDYEAIGSIHFLIALNRT